MNNINVPGEDNDDLDDDIELIDLPETNAKFTAQMRNHFIHLGPGEWKKGGVGTGTQQKQLTKQTRTLQMGCWQNLEAPEKPFEHWNQDTVDGGWQILCCHTMKCHTYEH